MRLLTLLKNKEKIAESLPMSSSQINRIIGGGQLGQMMAISAIYMGHRSSRAGSLRRIARHSRAEIIMQPAMAGMLSSAG